MEPRPGNFGDLFPLLVNAGVEFLLIGSGAAAVHGSTRLMSVVDVVYRRRTENYRRLVDALARRQPYLRGAPPGLPFRWNVQTIEQGLNFNLTTDLGDVNLLGSVTGGGTYDDLLPYCMRIQAFGVAILVVSLPKLIQLKRAAGRPKDLEVISELQSLLLESEVEGPAT
jgi:hypothetical protein